MKKALLIGVTSGLHSMLGASQTVDAWHTFLGDRGFNPIISLTGASADEQTIRSHLSGFLAGNAKPGDVLVLVVCAHGESTGNIDSFYTGDSTRTKTNSISEIDTWKMWWGLKSSGAHLYYISEACRDGLGQGFLSWMELWLRKQLFALRRGVRFGPGKESAWKKSATGDLPPAVVLKGCQPGWLCYYQAPGNVANFSAALMDAVSKNPALTVGQAWSQAQATLQNTPGLEKVPGGLADPSGLGARQIFT